MRREGYPIGIFKGTRIGALAFFVCLLLSDVVELRFGDKALTPGLTPKRGGYAITYWGIEHRP